MVWRVETQEWLSVAERAAALIANLPDETAQEVLDFARFLSARSRQTAGGKGLPALLSALAGITDDLDDVVLELRVGLSVT